MQQYPSIEYKAAFGTNVYAFDKLDGSSMRSCWNRKQSKKSYYKGFHKWGTRHQLTSVSDPNWGLGVKLFMEKYSEDLNRIFIDDKDFRNIDNIHVFFEYFGPNSFAGFHPLEDRTNGLMNVVMFDIHVEKKGILKPKDFIEKFSGLDIPKIIYEGNFNNKLVEDVRNNIYGLNEGVVVKGTTKTKRKDIENVFMCKVKTINWLERLKQTKGEKELLKELNGDQSLMV